MRGRRGFFLIWANVAVCLLLLLAGAAATAVGAALRYDAMAAREETALLLAEDALETMKYNARFGETIAVPTSVSRNGTDFRVRTETIVESVSGIPMKKVRVTVEDGTGYTVSFSCLVGRESAEETE